MTMSWGLICLNHQADSHPWLLIALLVLTDLIANVSVQAKEHLDDRDNLVERDTMNVDSTCRLINTLSVTRPSNAYCYTIEWLGPQPPGFTYGRMGALSDSIKAKWKAETCDGISEKQFGATGACFRNKWDEAGRITEFVLCCCRGYADCNSNNRAVLGNVRAKKADPDKWRDDPATAKELRTCVLNGTGLATPYEFKPEIAVCSLRDKTVVKDQDKCLFVYDQGKWTFGCASDFPKDRHLGDSCKDTTGANWVVKGAFKCSEYLCCCDTETVCNPSVDLPLSALDGLLKKKDIGTCHHNCYKNDQPSPCDTPNSTEQPQGSITSGLPLILVVGLSVLLLMCIITIIIFTVCNCHTLSNPEHFVCRFSRLSPEEITDSYHSAAPSWTANKQHSCFILRGIESADRYSDIIVYPWCTRPYKMMAVRGGSTTWLASDCPGEKNSENFFITILEKQITAIVNIDTNAEKKNTLYLPTETNKKIVYGEITVAFKGSSIVPNISDSSITEHRIDVYHGNLAPLAITVYSWDKFPDGGIPADPINLITFLNYVKNPPQKHIVIHCSAGIGRTGTVILTDLLMHKLETTNTPVVPSHELLKMRLQRAGIVQYDVQFLTVVRVVVEHYYARYRFWLWLRCGRRVRKFRNECENHTAGKGKGNYMNLTGELNDGEYHNYVTAKTGWKGKENPLKPLAQLKGSIKCDMYCECQTMNQSESPDPHEVKVVSNGPSDGSAKPVLM